MLVVALAAAVLMQPNPKVLLKRVDIELVPLAEPRCFKAASGEAMPCGKDPNIARVNWHAAATYTLEGADDVKGVAIAAPADGGRDLKIVLDGDELKDKDLKAEPVATGVEGASPATAKVFTANLKKGKAVKAVVSYDFAADATDGLYAGSHYPDGQVLWFDGRSQAQARYDPAMPFPGEVMRQNLGTLASFGAAPDEVRVRVGVPKGLGVLSLVPNAAGVACVDASAIYFGWKAAAPEGDLVVSYPTGKDGAHYGGKAAFTASYEYEAWNALLGSLKDQAVDKEKTRVPMACDLKDQLGAALPKYAAEGCVPKC